MGYTPGQSDLTIALLMGEHGLNQLRQAWNKIHSGMGCPAYYHDWRWMASLQKRLVDTPLYFVVAYRLNEVAIILPLRLRSTTKSGIKLDFISFPYQSDALIDSNLSEEKDFVEILKFLEAQKEFRWDYMRLFGMTDRSQLRESLPACGLKLEPDSTIAYFDLQDDKFDKTLSKKFIKNIKRLERKAESELGPIQVRLINDPAALPEAYETFLSLEASGWKGGAGTSTAIMHDARKVAFYRELLEQFSSDGLFQINLLELNGVPAAGQMCIRSGSTWYILKVGYNDEYKQYGTGNILMLAFLEKVSSSTGITELNLVSSPEWADRWHLEKRTAYSVEYFNSSVRGRLVRLMKRTKQKLGM